jgi:hypothetical protein
VVQLDKVRGEVAQALARSGFEWYASADRRKSALEGSHVC